MEGPATSQPAAQEPRWPRVMGTIGIVLAVLMVLDQLDDLVVLTWSEQQWSRFVGPFVGGIVARALDPAWVLLSAAVGMALGGLLFFGSLELRRRHHRGTILSRVWGWAAIAWALVDTGRGLWWLRTHGADLPGIAGAAVSGAAALGVSAALALLLAYPVFLLVWLARPPIREQIAAWPA